MSVLSYRLIWVTITSALGLWYLGLVKNSDHLHVLSRPGQIGAHHHTDVINDQN